MDLSDLGPDDLVRWPAYRLVEHGRVAYSDLATMDIDECECQNRILDAVLEARHIERKRNKGK